MKHIISTLFNSFEDYADSATQLHIYAFEASDEYEEAKEVSESHNHEKKVEYLAELGYYDDPVPCEPIPGLRYSSYDFTIVGNFLIIVETITLDV